jgi:hypothetical protein
MQTPHESESGEDAIRQVAVRLRDLAAELVFRDVPGKFVQRGGYAEWFRVRPAVALIDPVGCGVACILSAPTHLGFLPADGLAFEVTAGSLALSHSRIRIKPPLADPAGFLPGIGHVPSSSPGRWVGHFWRARAGHFW